MAGSAEINLFGAVYCCRAFLPFLMNAQRGKIILLSGGGATKPLPFLSAYAASKAGLVRFGETLAEELKDRGIDVNTVAPGALNTRLLDEVLEAGPERVGSAFYEASMRQKRSGGTPLDRGAQLCVYLASSESDGITGQLMSAVWDPWEKFNELRTDLTASDITRCAVSYRKTEEKLGIDAASGHRGLRHDRTKTRASYASGMPGCGLLRCGRKPRGSPVENAQARKPARTGVRPSLVRISALWWSLQPIICSPRSPPAQQNMVSTCSLRSLAPGAPRSLTP